MPTYILAKQPSGKTKKITVTFSAFPDGDTHCIVDKPEAMSGSNLLVVHSLYPQQNEQFMRLFFLLDTLRHIGASKVCVFVPYLPYARQDKAHIPGENISVDSVCRLLASSGCERLYTLDCHFMHGVPAMTRCGLPITSVSLGQELIAVCRARIGHAGFDVIGPDKGAAYLTAVHGMKHMHKERATYDGLPAGNSYRKIKTLVSDHLELKHNIVVVVDDMASTGSTLLRAVDNLYTQGAQNIYCAVTHGLFVGNSYDTLQSHADAVVCSDSIPQPFAIPMVEQTLKNTIIPAWINS